MTVSLMCLYSGSSWAQEAEPSAAATPAAEAPAAEAPAAEAPAAEAPEAPVEQPAPADGEASSDLTLPPLGVLVKIELTSGDTLRGTLVSADAETIVLQLPAAGQVTLQRTAVLSVSKADRAQAQADGRIYDRDPNRTRYLYGPSALGLEAGEGYVSQKELFFTAVGYGVTDNVTVLAGTVLPALAGGEFVGILGTKVSYSIIEDTLHVAAGGEAFVASFDDFGAIGFIFGSVTYGNHERHFTLTVGKPFQMDADGQELGPAIITASGAYRITPHVAGVTENWVILPDEDVDLFHFHGLAARLIWGSWAMDIGGVKLQDIEFPIPWIDVTFNF